MKSGLSEKERDLILRACFIDDQFYLPGLSLISNDNNNSLSFLKEKMEKDIKENEKITQNDFDLQNQIKMDDYRKRYLFQFHLPVDLILDDSLTKKTN